MTFDSQRLRALVHVYLAEERPRASPRTAAVRSARADWLKTDFLDAADESVLGQRLIKFYACVADAPIHGDALARRVRSVRYGLNHLLRGADPLPMRFEHCVRPDGAYYVPGLGRSFWAGVMQATDPDRLPGWTAATELGLDRLRLLKRHDRDRPGALLARIISAYDQIRAVESNLTATQIDEFLGRVAAMRGRELPPSARTAAEVIEDLVRQVRTRYPLRERLKAHRPMLRATRRQLEAALGEENVAEVRAAIRSVGPGDESIHDEALLDWARRLWSADDPWPVLADYFQSATLLGGGPSLPATILHLRDPRRFPTWDDETRRGLAVLDDGFDTAGPPAEGYRLFVEASDELRRRFRLHPLELPDLFSQATRRPDDVLGLHRFDGFCTDTFRFLAELSAQNDRVWMDGHRSRYQFAVREPLAQLCRELAARYVEPVLNQQFGWDLETEAKVGQALSSVQRNDHGRSVPYESALWITFYRRARGGKRDDVQLFVRLDARGVAAGLSLGRRAREAGRQFRKNVQQHAEALFHALAATDALMRCRFLGDDGQTIAIESAADVRKWASCKSVVAERLIAQDDLAVRGDDLIGNIILIFDRLLPAYRCAIEEDPSRALGPRPRPTFDPEQFCAATYLNASWLRTTTSLLSLKRQLILQGVSGTGKTHVARSLARLLTGGDEDRVRLVQFHPAFSYEEFVEGIKARTIEVDGRHEVTYPVEDGVLCQFAAQATGRPGETFVLVIDEINRGNLPRVFGELLYLLEYRDQEVTLPYSRRRFRLPPNLYLIGTMNAADRSVALVDLALRRRFSFLEMPPDVRVLASWLEAHPPADEAFGPRVVALFESVNQKLADDLGGACQVGHSHFMVRDLNPERLGVVWDHHVRPLLAEYFACHPQRLGGYDLDVLMGSKSSRPGRVRTAPRSLVPPSPRPNVPTAHS
jgi:5-methylcytosine-specific restriction protein B